MFPGNKHKAITFSFDDGVTQDRRLVQLFNKYGLKCTFNINSASLGKEGVCNYRKWSVPHNIIDPNEVAYLYKGHEVAVHTVHHPDLTILSEKEIIDEVEEDRKCLEKLVNYPIVGMAYPFGTVNEKVVETIKNHSPIQYSRTILATYNFDLQKDLLTFNPTVHCMDFINLEMLARKFVETKYEEDQIFYIWGHAYEFDFEDTWDRFEEILKYLSNRDDIFYGTNKEVLLDAR